VGLVGQARLVDSIVDFESPTVDLVVVGIAEEEEK